MNRAILAVVLVVFLSGCSGLNYVQYAPFTTETFPPKLFSEIEVFSARLPNRDFVEIGTLSLSGDPSATEARFIDLFKLKASQIGADAFIIQSHSVQVVGGGMYGGTFYPTRERVMRAIAIRWKESKR